MDVSESWFWYYIWCVNEERWVHFWKTLKFSLYWVYSKCLTCACVQVESTKKSYHQARKEEWTAANREAHAKADPTKSQEEVRKYTTRAERCNQDTEKVRCTCTHTLEHAHINRVPYIAPLVPVWVCLSPEKHTCVCFLSLKHDRTCLLDFPLVTNPTVEEYFQDPEREMINQTTKKRRKSWDVFI